MRKIFLSLVTVMTFASPTHGKDQSVEEFLRKFHDNPQKMMGMLPPEIVNGQVIHRGFLNDQILSRQLLEEKESLRQQVIRKAEFHFDPFSAFASDDDAKAMVDNGVVISNVFELDRRGLSSAALSYQLWSDTYWPISKGLIAQRYSQAGNPRDRTDWMANYSFYLANPTWTTNTRVLSPAEKYDLLVGDEQMTMTKHSWNRGRVYWETHNGTVPSWMGICHGWSAATHMRARIPYGAIDLKAADGRKIRFFQSDVKALVSLLWANTDLPTRFIGNRCNARPPRDGQGRTTDDKCRDNNPGAFYLAITNQLGINDRSFVMDATYDAEVWNFSVISYRSIYFNPQSLRQTNNIRQAVVPVSEFTVDKFRRYRAPGTAYVLGVAMDVTHLNETGASQKVQVKPATKTKRYMFDLELDAHYNVIGGEWYTRIHPDFLWTYSVGSQALAVGDHDINADDWNTKSSVPPGWREAARKSSKEGMPLFSVIKKILEAAPSTPPALSAIDEETGESLIDDSEVPENP